MDKIATFFNKYVGTDGMMHIIVCATLSALLKLVGINVFVVLGIVVAIAIAKEVYDKVSKKGAAEWKDIACDLFGILIGLL